MPVEDRSLEMGEIAYNGYCQATGWKSLVSGEDLPPFKNLKPEIQEAWFKTYFAVLFSLMPGAYERYKEEYGDCENETDKQKEVE